MAEEKTVSPLTQYIRWLRAENAQFPADANNLYIGTLYNLTEDDWKSCVLLNGLINEDAYLGYKMPIELFGELHKQSRTKDNPQFIRSNKKKDVEAYKAVRSVMPHLKDSQIEQLLSIVEDRDMFLKSIGYGDMVGKLVKTEQTLTMLQNSLEENLELCCGNCSNNNQYVFFDSNTTNLKDIKCVFIGEAPADKEIEEGKPFVGKSGQLLRETIKTVDPTISWMITNTCMCYHKPGTAPTEKELKSCFGNLEIIFSFLGKNVVLIPLGKTALMRLGITDRATDAIKKIYKYGNYTVVPNVHPSYVLRGGMSREAFLERMKEAVDVVTGVNKKRGKRTDKATAEDVLKMLNGEVALNLQEALPEEAQVVDAKPVVEEEEPVPSIEEMPPLPEELANTLNAFVMSKLKNDEETGKADVVQPNMITTPTEQQSSSAPQPPNVDVETDPMLVDTVYDDDRGVVYHILWDGKKKKIIETTDDFIIHKGNTNRYVEQRAKLNEFRIRYKDRWKYIKDQTTPTFGADISIAVHKNIDWRKKHPNEATYKLRVCALDIEVYTNNEPMDFSNLEVAATKYPINLITLYDNYEETYYTMVYNLNGSTINEEQIKRHLDYADDCKFKIFVFEKEQDMLKALQRQLDELDPNIVTGWNSDGFDFPFLKARYDFLGIPYVNKYGGGINLRTYQKEGVVYTDAELKFMYALDYMRLYKEMSFGKRESYSLGFISKFELGVTKLELEDHMDDVFNEDINKFIAYNINDVHLIRLLENKLKYIELMYGIVRITNIGMREAFTTLRIIDGLIYTYLYDRGLTCRVRPMDNSKENLLGAYVRTPVKGIFEWMSDLDLSSLYPYIMARLNLSMDTYVGKIDEDVMYNYIYHRDMFDAIPTVHISLSNNQEGDVTPQKFHEWITNNNYIVTIAGTIFKSHEEEQSILYEIIDLMINERKKYKKLMLEAVHDNDDQMYDRYDNMQMTYKVITNAIYGAMGNAGFRFFSNELAQTITKTGRELSRIGAFMVNEYFKRMIDEKSIDVEPIEIDPDFPTKAEGTLEHIVYGDSVTGEMTVFYNGKYVSIGEMWQDLTAQNTIIKDGGKDRIYPHNVTTLTFDGDRTKESNVEYIMRHKTNKPIYRVETENGNYVEVTSDHSVMVWDDVINGVVEKKPSELTENDVLVVASV